MTGSRTSHALGLIGAIVRVIMIVLVHAGQGKAVRASETPTFVSVDVAPTPARKTNLGFLRWLQHLVNGCCDCEIFDFCWAGSDAGLLGSDAGRRFHLRGC